MPLKGVVTLKRRNSSADVLPTDSVLTKVSKRDAVQSPLGSLSLLDGTPGASDDVEMDCTQPSDSSAPVEPQSESENPEDSWIDIVGPTSYPSITIPMMFVNLIVLQAKRSDSLIIEYKQRFKIFQHHLACFVPGQGMQQWLDDHVIDYYLAMVVARKKANPRKYASAYLFHSSFYALLGSSHGLNVVGDAADGDEIFNYDYIFFPVCQSNHWRLIVAEVAKKTVFAYNSLQSFSDLLICKNIIRYLNHENRRLLAKDESCVDISATGSDSDWKTELNLSIPQQGNGDDCGIFTLLYADHLICKKPFDFDNSHICYFRAKMLYESISGRLLPYP